MSHSVEVTKVTQMAQQLPLLGIERVADHLPDCLGNGVVVDAEDLEQLVGLATAWNVSHSQTMHHKAGFIHHR